MTNEQAINKVMPTLERIKNDIETIRELINKAIKNPEQYDEKETKAFINKISSEWEDELKDAKTLLGITAEINKSTPVLVLEEDDL